MIVKKKLLISRDDDILEIDDGDNFQATFDIDSIGGSLTFDLPYFEPDYQKIQTPSFRMSRLKKFDKVFLYYAEIEKDRIVKKEEWFQIFNGYIETVNLSKTKQNHRYTITCNSMLALSNYFNAFTLYSGTNIALMPYKILQHANMQFGQWNDMPRVNPKDIIPEESLDVKIPTIYDRVFAGNFNEKNCKETIDEFRKKFGLIFTENMDGIVQVTTLTNYLVEAENIKFAFKSEEDKEPIDRVKEFNIRALAKDYIESKHLAAEKTGDFIRALKNSLPKLAVYTGTYLDIVTLNTPFFTKMNLGLGGVKKGIMNVSTFISDKLGLPTPGPDQQKEMLNQLSFQNIIVEALLRKKYLRIVGDMQQIITDTPTREIENVWMFDANENIFDLRYPEVTTEYDGVIVYGYEAIGKAIDMTSIALKDIQPDPDTNEYALNMLKIYRRDINEVFTLNKLAREELYKLKQENKISFKTVFSPFFRVGMPLTIVDYDRYTGKELFICTKISYTLSKNNIECTLEGMTSILNTLPEKLITDRPQVMDVLHLGLEEKIKNIDWVDDWQ